MDKQNLSTKLADALEYIDIEIPEYITQNLSKTLRDYQVEALKHYLLQRQKPSTNHLMFNMATGSGKTLIMAALMLECYKSGYRNFVFFAPYNNIVEKTKSNFCDERSEKYLFSREIIINGEQIKIKMVNSLIQNSENGTINIYFSTISTLFNRLKEGGERENSLTLQDLQDKKIVFLADEAHHLNAETKQKLSKSEEEDKQNWEGVTKKAFKANEENLLLEFSATIPKFESVLEKYSDKIVYEYALKQFHNDGFSKKIYLLKYNGLEIEERFLGSVILNIYRMLLAQQQGFFLKPVILYKSRFEAESKENEKLFREFITNLNANQVGEFIQTYANLSKSDDDESVLFFEAREFFKSRNLTDEAICTMIKELFSAPYIINVNDKTAEEQRQILLNSLESRDNEIRAIFAVDKLNEGWDVLNLFDIVRLNKGAIKDTTKEAQLIGRGARYYPFTMQDCDEFRRKFDTQRTPLKALEILTYHAASENEFISRLNSELMKMGLPAKKSKNIILRVKKEIMQSEFYKEAYFATNTRYKVSSQNSLFADEVVRRIISKSDFLEIPLFNAKGVEQENLIKDERKAESNKPHKPHKFRDFPQSIILKAMNILHKTYNFATLSKNFDVQSKRDFIAKCLNLTIKLHPRQTLSESHTRLKIALFVLEKFGENLNKYLDSYKVGSWRARALETIGDKEITRDENREEFSGYEWFYFDKFVGTTLEREFLDFVESKKELINKHFAQWLIVRNERFSELAIYDDREFLANGEENKNYADRFEPDFYFLGKRVCDNRIIMQCIIEPKGEKWQDDDKWKEEFLATLFNKKPIEHKGVSIKLQGMPFFSQQKRDEFREKFEGFVKSL